MERDIKIRKIDEKMEKIEAGTNEKHKRLEEDLELFEMNRLDDFYDEVEKLYLRKKRRLN